MKYAISRILRQTTIVVNKRSYGHSCTKSLPANLRWHAKRSGLLCSSCCTSLDTIAFPLLQSQSQAETRYSLFYPINRGHLLLSRPVLSGLFNMTHVASFFSTFFSTSISRLSGDKERNTNSSSEMGEASASASAAATTTTTTTTTTTNMKDIVNDSPVTLRFDWESYKATHNSFGSFSIASFNMLAPCYKRLEDVDSLSGGRKRESSDDALWTERANNTIEFLTKELYQNIDIIGFQEFWLDPNYLLLFSDGFQANGYEIIYLQRTGRKMDSVLTAVRSSVFEILGRTNVYLCTLGDRVALILHLRHRSTGKMLLVANTHLSFPHSAFDRVNQIHQMKK